MLDEDDPTRLIARSTLPLICPERTYEREGFAPDVLFPTGAIYDEKVEELILFSGCADEVVSVLKLSVDSILEHLREADFW
jgi:predicted GH43/DUF377 family glycosyl hydrolase